MRIVTAALLFAVGSASPGDAPPVEAIDHLIVGVSNLEDGIAEFERLSGIKAVVGGVHPGRGTQNALISLSLGRYLEILAPSHVGQLASNLAYLSALRELTPVGWAVSTIDMHRTTQRLKRGGFEVTALKAGSRERPDGSKLEWKTSELAAPVIGLAPFLIQWSPESTHPSKTSPAGCSLTSLELAGPAAEKLRQLAATLAIEVAVKEGVETLMTITLSCPRGQVVLGPGAPK
jgi:hypothetical protein